MATPLAIFKAEVLAIQRVANVVEDDEVAHGKEDALHVAVLEFIAKQSTDAVAREAARVALSTRALNFARRCS